MSGLSLMIFLYIVADILIKWWLHIDLSYDMFSFAVFTLLYLVLLLFPFWNITVVSEHNLGSACAFNQYVTIRRSFSQKEEMYKKDKKKTPLFGGREEGELSMLLFQTMKSIKGDLKKMRREMCRDSPREFESEANSRFLHDECEHAATHYDSQRSHMPRSTMREMEEEEMPRMETLSDYLQEFESQTKRFKDHITFQEFCKINVKIG